MPKELIMIGAALLFGAWFVIDQRSFSEKVGLIVIIFICYVIYQYLGGATLSDIFNPIIDFFNLGTPPAAPIEE
jgi:hypothetical protein